MASQISTKATQDFVEPLCIAEEPGKLDRVATVSHGNLTVSLIAGRDLHAEQVSRWRELQGANSQLESPCFAPEFTQAVASVRDDVEVAVLKRGDVIEAFFPFQRRKGGRAIPVGGVVSDYQGLICTPRFTCDPRHLLKACHLVSWKFDRLLCSQEFFAAYRKQCALSARIDLSEGYAAYVAQRRAAGTRQIRQCEYMMRRMEREVGRLRFVTHSGDPELLAQVLAWKSEQYRRSGWNDLFATRWGRALVGRLQSLQSPAFGGVLSLLYAGPRLVAGHLGMRSQTIWHYWFPAYDRQFARYSPGLILLLMMAQCAPEFGLRFIDIGTGISLYKQRLMNASISVAEGSLESSSCRGLLRRVRQEVRSWLTRFRVSGA